MMTKKKPRSSKRTSKQPQLPKRPDRQVLGLEDFTDEDIAAIKRARMPKKYNYLNKELKNWRP